MTLRTCRLAFALVIAGAVLGCQDRTSGTSAGYRELGDLPALRERGAIRILTPPLADTEGLPRQGHLIRLEQELIEAFVRLEGLEPLWIWVDERDDLIPALLDGRGDVIAANLTATPNRRELVAFGAPLTTVRERIVSGPDAPAIESVDDLTGREVVVRASSSYVETLETLLIENPDIYAAAAPEDMETEEILYRVSQGEFDVTLADDRIIRDVQAYLPDLRVGPEVTGDREIAWAFRPDNSELIDAADAFIYQYNPASDIPDRYTGDLDQIKQRGVLRVLTRNNPSTYFVYRGHVMGFEYDLAREFARRHGLHAQFIVVPTRAGLITWLVQGRGDIVAAGMTATEFRTDIGAQFSRPYAFISEIVVARPGDSTLVAPSDLSGRTIVVRRGSSYWQTAVGLQERGIDVQLVAASEALETEDIIDGVASGEHDLTIADSNILDIELTWREDIIGAFSLGDSIGHAWAMRETDAQLKAAVDAFFSAEYRGEFYNITRRKYFNPSMRVRRHATSRAALTGVLSPYDELFRNYANRYQVDWLLVAAQSYQESRFDPDVVSFAGAVGLMQVMPGTGRELGFESLHEPEQGVHAGVMYLYRLYNRLDEIPDDEDRLWFSLAAYNAGLGHVNDARRLAVELGRDPDVWFGEVAEVMPLLQKREYYSRARHGYCRCTEPVDYVARIRDRYRAYSDAIADSAQASP
jgi:membrane-bound lytic murein transglycosylase F